MNKPVLHNKFIDICQKIFSSFKRQDSENLILLILLAFITLLPLLSVRFTTYDDALIAINFGGNLGSGLFEVSKAAAAGQGRISYFWAYPLLRLPYIIDNQIWYLSIKYGAFLLVMSALYFLISRLFKSSWIALTTLALFLMFIQNGWDHNVLTSYPFVFNFLAALFLLSLGLLSIAIDRQSIRLASLSALLYFFTLGNEIFILFFPFFAGVLLIRVESEKSAVHILNSRKIYLLPHAMVLLTYLVMYATWRYAHPSSYDGNRISGVNLFAAGKVIAAYSLSAFPLASLNFMISPTQQISLTDSIGWRAILSGLSALPFVKAAIAGLLIARLLVIERFTVPSERTIIVGIYFSCIGIFLPNLLLGFVLKYQNWVAAGSYSYLYTYYSFISTVVFGALVLTLLNSKSRSWHPNLRSLFVVFVVTGVALTSFAVEVRNQYIAFDQKLSHRKWQLMDKVISTPAFMAIPDGSSIVAPTLSSHHRAIAVAPADYWTKYVKYKTGKKVLFVDDKCEIGAPCYSLIFRQELHTDSQFVALAKITKPDSMATSDALIFTLPNASSPNLALASYRLKLDQRVCPAGAWCAPTGHWPHID